jgi:hypothetical protein
MNTELNSHPQFEIIKFLYQFKDDNKFYKLDESLLNIQSKKEKYILIYTLRDHALIATDSEIYYNHADNSVVDHFNNSGEIKAKILPKGIVALETLLGKACSL